MRTAPSILQTPPRRRTGATRRAADPGERAWSLRNTDPKRARELAAEALARAQAAGDTRAAARAGVVLGTLDVLRSRGGDARPILREALGVLEEEGDDVACGRACIALANADVADDDADGAEKLARRGLRFARDAKDRRLELDALLCIAQVMARRSQYDKATHWADKAWSLLEESDLSRRGQLLAFRGYVGFMTGASGASLSDYREALACATQGGNDRLRCFVLTMLCRAEAEQGDYTSALEHALENARLAEGLDMTATLARAYTAIGIIHKRFGDYERAREFAERTLELGRTVGSQLLQASATNAIGNCLYATGAHDAALARYREAEAIAREIEDRELLSDLLENIGNVLRDQRAFEEAFEQYTASLTIAHELGDVQRMAELQLNIGRLNADRDAVPEAIACFERALAIAASIGNNGLLSIIHNELASAHERVGATAAALEHLRTHMALKEELTSAVRQREIAALENRAAAERLERERQVQRLEHEKLALDIRHRSEELTALGVRLAERTELLQTLGAELRSAIEATGAARERQLRSILAAIAEREEAEGGWVAFEQQMQQVHHGFIVTLAQRYPSLRPAELKVCALLRTQLSSKQIASLLCVTERAVEKHRYSIRRKLGLAASDNLVSVLSAAGTSSEQAPEQPAEAVTRSSPATPRASSRRRRR